MFGWKLGADAAGTSVECGRQDAAAVCEMGSTRARDEAHGPQVALVQVAFDSFQRLPFQLRDVAV